MSSGKPISEESPILLPLPWDSEFFRSRLGRIQAAPRAKMEKALAAARQEGYSCLYFNAAAGWDEGLRWAARAGFFPVGLRVSLAAPAGPTPEDPERPVGEDRSPEGEKALIRWAVEELSPFSRYARDPLFGEAEARRLYRHWAAATLDGQRAQVVLFADAPGEKPAGFLSLRTAGGEISIDLVAVSPSCRGRGWGRALLRAALGRAAEGGYPSLRVATQGNNTAALAAYGAAGFKIETIEHCFHIHLNEEKAKPERKTLAEAEEL